MIYVALITITITSNATLAYVLIRERRRWRRIARRARCAQQVEHLATKHALDMTTAKLELAELEVRDLRCRLDEHRVWLDQSGELGHVEAPPPVKTHPLDCPCDGCVGDY